MTDKSLEKLASRIVDETSDILINETNGDGPAGAKCAIKTLELTSRLDKEDIKKLKKFLQEETS